MSQPTHKLRTRPGWRLVWGTYFCALICSILLTAGATVLIWIEDVPLFVTVERQSQPAYVLLCASVTVVITIGAALVLLRDPKRFFFSNALFVLVSLSSVVICELMMRLMVPAWPARGLHGVEGRYALRSWGRSTNEESPVRVNEWGQRDRSRRRRPRPGVRRFICVGDSFLEEARDAPLPPLLDDLLGSAHEVVNLGVSATDPDEYYYRFKNIGLRLCPDHCVLFFYAGNDFLRKPSLKSYAGVAATYPRDSFLASVELQGINHALTNHKRPVLRLWSDAADLVRRADIQIERQASPRDITFQNAAAKPKLREKSTRTTIMRRFHPDAAAPRRGSLSQLLS